MFRNVFSRIAPAPLALGAMAGGGAGPAVQGPTIQVESNKGALHTERVSRRAMRVQVAAGGFQVHGAGGRAPWIDKHGYLLRQVRRPLPRSAR